MTWNVENLKSDGGPHKTYITAALQQFVAKYKPDIVVLQEVEACDLVAHALSDWACVGSVVPEHVESNLPHVVLGNVVLYNTKLFLGSKPNRVLTTGFKEAARRIDRSGNNLFDHHGEKCSWEEYNGCKNSYADMPSATSIKLFLRKDEWATEVRSLFPGGLRVVNVHLFAGGRHGGLSEASKAHRRRFQMRSLMALVDSWNAKDTTGSRSSNAPVTIYAGDFNTRRKHELQEIAAPAEDYGMRLWCPADGGWCDTTLSKYKTHKAGTLDHVVVDIRREFTSSPFLARASVLRQPTSGKGQGGSDHDPLFVQMKPSPSAARPPTNQAPPVLNDDSFPSLSG
jgi:endonuclease/exonuclease/phosphatase family metal-dependent hydrolase